MPATWTTPSTWFQEAKVLAAQLNQQVRDNLLWLHDAATPTGALLAFAGTSAPSGYLLCDGTAVSRTTYSTLFGVIGTSFGVGDGSTTFNLPDLRGRVPVGLDNLGGSSANRVVDAQGDALGGSLGTETHTLTEDEIPAHAHTERLSPGDLEIYRWNGSSGSVPGFHDNNTTNTINTGAGPLTTADTGGGTAHENMQPSLFIGYIIRT